MLIARIEGATRVCGKSQGFLGLPVRDEVMAIAGADTYNIMHTAWEPTPDELAKLNAGAKVIVSVIGNNPQPIKLSVG